jgi:hypothetical protein
MNFQSLNQLKLIQEMKRVLFEFPGHWAESAHAAQTNSALQPSLWQHATCSAQTGGLLKHGPGANGGQVLEHKFTA